jgi:hypothetical protein
MLDKIESQHVSEVRLKLETVCVIIKEEITDRRMTFHINPRMDVSAKRRIDMEWEIIKKFCNAPFVMYSDHSSYRFTLACN